MAGKAGNQSSLPAWRTREKVTVAFLVAVGAAESGRPNPDVPGQGGRPAGGGRGWGPAGVACDGLPRRCPTCLARYSKAGGDVPGLPDSAFNAKQLDQSPPDRRGRRLAGTVQLWEWNRRRGSDDLQLLTSLTARPRVYPDRRRKGAGCDHDGVAGRALRPPSAPRLRTAPVSAHHLAYCLVYCLAHHLARCLAHGGPATGAARLTAARSGPGPGCRWSLGRRAMAGGRPRPPWSSTMLATASTRIPARPGGRLGRAGPTR